MREVLPRLIDSLADAVVVVDPDHQVVAANRRYLEAFGPRCVHRTSVGCPFVPACDETPADGNGPRGTECVAGRLRVATRRLRNLPDRHGTVRSWEATFTPITDRRGRLRYIVEVWRDIHERSPLEAQLAHSERLASLGVLAAGVAHEINNPIASLLSGVERLQRWFHRSTVPGSNANTEPLAVLESLEREVLRCRDATEKLLLIAQPQRSAPTWVDLNRAVRDTLSLIDHQMTRQHIRADLDLDPQLPTVWGRESGIRGVCMNLALNAVQAMPGGGLLTVRTRRRGTRAVIEVQDDGPGVAPEHVDRIWDPFFTTKPPGQGTGLGLTISRQVIANHGGGIRVERPAEGGARFVVELPVDGSGGECG